MIRVQPYNTNFSNKSNNLNNLNNRPNFQGKVSVKIAKQLDNVDGNVVQNYVANVHGLCCIIINRSIEGIKSITPKAVKLNLETMAEHGIPIKKNFEDPIEFIYKESKKVVDNTKKS